MVRKPRSRLAGHNPSSDLAALGHLLPQGEKDQIGRAYPRTETFAGSALYLIATPIGLAPAAQVLPFAPVFDIAIRRRRAPLHSDCTRVQRTPF